MFDVYVSGIDPNRIGEIDQIRQNVSKTLGVTGNDLELLLSTEDHMVCIQENVPESSAIKIRQALTSMGLLCSYRLRAGGRWGDLSLEEHDGPNESVFKCPACQFQQPITEEGEPQKCPNCGLNIEKYQQEQAEQQEYKELREKLLQKSQAGRVREAEEKRKEQEKTRKAELEKKVAADLGIKTQEDWKSSFNLKQIKKSHLIAGGVILGILLVIAVAPLFTGSNSSEQTTQNIPDTTSTSEPASASTSDANPPDNQSSPNLPTAASATADELPSQTDINGTGTQSSVPAATSTPNGVAGTIAEAERIAVNSRANSQLDIADTPASANAQQLVVAEGQTDGQAALAQTHANVSKFLGSMGINAEAEAAKAETMSGQAPKSSISGSALNAPVTPTQSSVSTPAAASASVSSQPAALNNTVANIAPTTTEQLTNTNSSANDLPKASNSNLNHQLTDNIYNELLDDPEWDDFLFKKTDGDTKLGKLKTAYSLNQLQNNLSHHISITGELLDSFNKLGRHDLFVATLDKLNQRISSQPLDMQAIYKEQLGLILQKQGSGQNLLAEAEIQAGNITDPVRQSRVFSKIAVNQKLAGQTDFSKNFNLAEEKLKNVSVSFEQFSGYIDLAHEYIKANNATSAEVAMIMAEFTLNKLPEAQHDKGLAQLLETAFLVNDPVYINKFSTRIHNPEYRSLAAYQYIRDQLQNGVSDLTKPLSYVKTPEYAALSNSMAALMEKDSSTQNILANTAKQNLLEINDVEIKALITSKIARYLARQGKTQEANSLFEQARNLSQTLVNPKQRDATLIILAIDKAKVWQIENALQTANLIQDDQLKATALAMIKNIESAKSLVMN